MADANADATSDDEWFGLSPSAKKRNEAEELYQQVKHLVNEEGKYFVALEKLKQAINLLPIERYKRRLQQLEDYIKSENLAPESNELKAEPPKNDIKTATTDPNFMKLSTGLKVRKELYDKLYNYQIEGVNWMHALFLQMEGGILADDMGLGKTVQSIALLSSLLESKAIKHVLIVAPTTLLINWGKEFYKWAPLVKVYKFDGSLTPTKRLHNLKCVQTRGGVLLCTYDLCRSNSENFSICDRRNFVWDYLILDEGHKIKNPTKTTQKIHEVPSRTRLMLTGTPVQNNLRELWSLYDFVMKGTLLGSYATFKTKYEDPILRGRERNASKRDIIKSKKIAEDLRQIYGPYFLRRTKNQVFKGKNSMVTLPRKFDWVIWIQLNEAQIAVYRNFLESDTVKQLILQANMRSCLLHIITLKKICDHPRLLPERVCDEVLRIKRFGDSQLSDSVLNGEDLFAIDNVSDDELIKESGKLAFCLNLLENLKEEAQKCWI
ncbi:hypothetical protein B4U80_02174 [Leptotrombidium deliense]|uniref:Helicase ATP-binding domain-containing protein n=1 Tax=Leptotrombidium deliense TaxID=299467 RepID=A0A443SFZ8_9ACAR|nr:hypothetical protein B4U80_02174 [Leptotrombidium deliense]